VSRSWGAPHEGKHQRGEAICRGEFDWKKEDPKSRVKEDCGGKGGPSAAAGVLRRTLPGVQCCTTYNELRHEVEGGEVATGWTPPHGWGRRCMGSRTNYVLDAAVIAAV